MNTVAIICEYNPFHNGHRYQIARAKELSGCDTVVCIMSGSFVQRGDIAVFDKWARAEAALKNGADLVIELPVWYVLQSADMFANGAVEILARSHIADAVSFGSESVNTDALLKCGQILANESVLFKDNIEKLMAEGMGYPSALRKCIASVYPDLNGITQNPNDMLGASYISAMIKSGAMFEIIPVERKCATHDSKEANGVYASSSAIRRFMMAKQDASLLTPMDLSLPVYKMKNIESFILGFLRTCREDTVSDVPGTEPGLEKRLISAAHKSTSLEELFELSVSKRYSLSRVRRTILASVLGLKKDMTSDYIRILGMTDKGAQILKSAKNKSELEFVTKTADFTPSENSMFQYDVLATDIAALACDNQHLRKSGTDFYRSPVKI